MRVRAQAVDWWETLRLVLVRDITGEGGTRGESDELEPVETNP